MNAAEAKTECDEAIALIDHLLSVWTYYPTTSDLLSATYQLVEVASGWQGAFLATPAGSPADLRTSAADISEQLNVLVTRRSNLLTQAEEIETSMVGQAGAAHARELRALAAQLDFESTGLGILHDGTRDYANALETGQTTVDTARAALVTARTSTDGLDTPADYSEVWEDARLEAAWAAVRAAYQAGRSGLLDAAGGLGAIVEAERVFAAALSDSAGYARLSGLPESSAVTTLDAILALVDGVDDPDTAIVSDAEWADYVSHLEALTPAERADLQEALDAARTPEERQVIITAFATGAGLTLTLGLARELGTMTPKQVADVAGLQVPQESGDGRDVQLRTADGTPLIQETETTCGSASLLMLAAQRDPFLALLIAEGRTIDGHIPPYVDDLPMIDLLETVDDLTPEERLTYLQESIRIRTNAFRLWPGSLVGSAPWGYGDEVARALDIRIDMDYSVLGPAGNAQQLVDDAIVAVDEGTPVPFLVGGDSGVPMHYIVLVGHSDGMLEFYEPGSGQLRSVSIDDAVTGGEWTGAFGGWTSIYGAGLPAS